MDQQEFPVAIRITPGWPDVSWSNFATEIKDKDSLSIHSVTMYRNPRTPSPAPNNKTFQTFLKLEGTVLEVESCVPLYPVVLYKTPGKNLIFLFYKGTRLITFHSYGAVCVIDPRDLSPPPRSYQNANDETYTERAPNNSVEKAPTFDPKLVLPWNTLPSLYAIWYQEWYDHLACMWKWRPHGLYVTFDDFTRYVWMTTKKVSDPRRGPRKYPYPPSSKASAHKREKPLLPDVLTDATISYNVSRGIYNWYNKIQHYISERCLKTMQHASLDTFCRFLKCTHECNCHLALIGEIPLNEDPDNDNTEDDIPTFEYDY
jgi:hypothetical protein